VSSESVPPDLIGPLEDTIDAGDPWSAWLLSRRQGGRDLQPDQRAELKRYCDGVLAGANLQPGDVLLDVGCGDGLIGFEASNALDHAVRLVFSDVSAELLQRCAERAAQMKISDNCRFVQARAEDLAGIGDRSIDAVTTRSVLIYVTRKRDALAEFFRVLRPGGRLSIFEPINRRLFPEPANLFWGWDVSAAADLRDRVALEFGVDSRPELQSMMNFDENDLVELARDVGFDAVELVLHVADKRPPGAGLGIPPAFVAQPTGADIARGCIGLAGANSQRSPNEAMTHCTRIGIPVALIALKRAR
jgi:arsenite methyltransferase